MTGKPRKSNPAYIRLRCSHYTTALEQETFHGLARLLPGGKTPDTTMLYCEQCREWYTDPRKIKTVPLPNEPIF